MYSTKRWNANLPATLSPRIVDGLLRGEIGWDGAVCTDCMEMKAITRGFGAGESAVLAVQAGVDMPLFSHTRRHQEAAYASVLEAARSGAIPLARIDQSVERVRRLKDQFALADPPALDLGRQRCAPFAGAGRRPPRNGAAQAGRRAAA